jgi:hypothetical protein
MPTFLENLQCVVRLEYSPGMMGGLFLFGCIGCWWGLQPPQSQQMNSTVFYGALGILFGAAVGAVGEALLHNACGITIR